MGIVLLYTSTISDNQFTQGHQEQEISVFGVLIVSSLDQLKSDNDLFDQRVLIAKAFIPIVLERV